ncbi:hypothetical protein AC579_8640 [Pseudocercospora musae]|uniref:Uncharacterized protein n=1 Tax=Pseudocercospora musae TaxID=113226 RepID=A0A139IFI8_9PEZI|nr:hypothetical protein AC579_8640 [Pseudocercospora musae]
MAAATATTPAPSIDQMTKAARPVARYPATQPPSYKPPEFRKTQLHRQYQSLLRSSPLMLIFQHNNLKSIEFMSIRRELAQALRKVDEELAKNGNNDFIGDHVKLSVVQTGIFASALKVVEFWDPKFGSEMGGAHGSKTKSLKQIHGLSKEAWMTAKKAKAKHGLEALLSGPLCLLSVPTVSPQHLKAALTILAPNSDFPAPKRKSNPSYHEPAVQSGLQKLMLLGARIEGKSMDTEGARWVGSIEGGLEGLRGQLVAMLQSIGAGVTNALTAASTNLYLTMEGRKMMMEEEEGKKEGEGKSDTSTEKA